MDTFQNRLNKALIARNISPAQLSRLTGINEATISNYRNGKYKPKQAKTELIAEKLGVNIAWIMGADCPMTGKIEPALNFKSIGTVAAGYDKPAYEDFGEDFFSVPVEVIKGYSKEDFIHLIIEGDSMFPHFYDGDHILVLRTPMCENGAIAVVQYGEEVNGTLKKVFFEGSGVRLDPLNKKYESVFIKGPDLDYFKIVGIPKFLTRSID